MGDPTLKFNVDLSYGCTLEYTLQELKDNCNPVKNPLDQYEIFSNLNEIDSFGRFGNAYVYYPKVSLSISWHMCIFIVNLLCFLCRIGAK